LAGGPSFAADEVSEDDMNRWIQGDKNKKYKQDEEARIKKKNEKIEEKGETLEETVKQPKKAVAEEPLEETVKQPKKAVTEETLEKAAKQPKKAVIEEPLKKTTGQAKEVVEQKKFYFIYSLGFGMFKLFDSIGEVLNFGGGVCGKFQFDQLYKGLGVELEVGYLYNSDRENKNSFVHLVPGTASLQYKFNTKIISYYLNIGAGCSYTMYQLPMRSKTSVDPIISATVGISKTIKSFVIGTECKYYYFFESLSASAISIRLFVGGVF